MSKTTPPRILQFMPAYRSTMHPAVHHQLAADARWCIERGITCDDGWQDKLGIDLVRNWAIEEARRLEYDYLYFQDADTYGVGLVLPLLLELALQKQAAITAAGYLLRRVKPTLGVHPVRVNTVYQGQFAGTGMMLIDLLEINRIAEVYRGPWCKRTYVDERHTQLGEGGDVHLCRIVAAHGGSLWIDTRIETVHAYLDTDRLHYTPAGGESQHSGGSTG
jgi:hypothetical protein